MYCSQNKCCSGRRRVVNEIFTKTILRENKYEGGDLFHYLLIKFFFLSRCYRVSQLSVDVVSLRQPCVIFCNEKKEKTIFVVLSFFVVDLQHTFQ